MQTFDLTGKETIKNSLSTANKEVLQSLGAIRTAKKAHASAIKRGDWLKDEDFDKIIGDLEQLQEKIKQTVAKIP